MRLGKSQGREQVPIDWISEFRKGTELTQFSVSLRPDLTPAREAEVIERFTDVLDSRGTLRVPIADRDAFTVTYGLRLSKVVPVKSVPRFLEATYVVDSGPNFNLTLPE